MGRKQNLVNVNTNCKAGPNNPWIDQPLPTILINFPAAEEVPEQGLGEDEEGERVGVGGRGRREKIRTCDPGRGNLLPRLSLRPRTSQIEISLNVNENVSMI